MTRLKQVISGCQTGADIGALRAAKAMGFLTGGIMPKGFKTQDGNRPEYANMFNIVEHESPMYPPRTFLNVKNACATIRIATDINSSGERCTLKAITQYKKPYFDVHVEDTRSFKILAEFHPKIAARWVVYNNVEVLNVAGNSERTSPGIEAFTERYVKAVLRFVSNNDLL